MAEAKQVPLNGAYYGPAIPPQQNIYRRRRGCSGPCCCLLSTLLKLIITIIVVVGIAVLVLWLIYRPSKMKVYVNRASISQFNLTNDNILHYNFSVDFAIRNPNKKIGIYYDRLEARPYYEGQRFDMVLLPTFYQGHKNTTNLSAVFQGQNFIQLDSSEVEELNREKNLGFVFVDVRIYARIRFKIGSLKTNRYKPEFECELSLPFSPNGGSPASFGGARCDVDF